MSDINTSDRDVSRAIRSWLHEDRHEDVSRVAGAVLDQVEETPQRRSTWWPARRKPTMNKFVNIGLGAAAVVAVLLIGPNLLGSSGPAPGGEPSASAAPSEAAPSVEPAGARELPDGSLLLWDGEADGVSITVTIPGDGWWGSPGQGWFTNSSGPNPPGTGMIVYGSVEEYYVYGDPCHWQTTRPDTPAATVDEMVAALQSQAPGTEDDHDPLGVDSWASEPTDVSVDGYNGRSITLHAPAIFAHDCDRDQMAIFASEDRSPDRYLQRGGPDGGSMQGQTDELWIVDVNGQIVVLDLAYYSATPQATLDELRGILASATFDVP
jgi:hypothetical protein